MNAKICRLAADTILGLSCFLTALSGFASAPTHLPSLTSRIANGRIPDRLFNFPLTHAARKPTMLRTLGASEAAIFSGASPGVRLRNLPSGEPQYEVRRVSPDARYVAVLLMGGGEVADLTVYRTSGKKGAPVIQSPLSREFDDAHGCAWITRHGHWLVVTTGGADYGAGMVALWTGAGQIRLLRRAKTFVADGYNLKRVSANGRKILYEHTYQRFRSGDPYPLSSSDTLHWLTLP